MPSRPSLSIIDNRTAKLYEVPIAHNAVRATDFKQIKDPATGAEASTSGILVSDPGLRNTAVVESQTAYMYDLHVAAIESYFINGSKGILEYRGNAISDLFSKNLEYEDIAFLLIWGHVPSAPQKLQLRRALNLALLAPADTVFSVVHAFPPTAPPMTMILAGLSAHLSSRPTDMPAFTGSSLYEGSLDSIEAQIPITISTLALVVSATYCHRTQQAFTPPDPTLSFVANVFRMLGRPLSPAHVSCVDKLWMLYADHGMANATAAFLHTASTRADPMSCLIAALSAGYGPLHGGAIDMVYHMLSSVGSVDNVPALIEEVKGGRKSGKKLYGFGHRIYETEDPRAGLVKKLLSEFDTSKLEILKVAEEIERVASLDEWFKRRRIRMNVDLYGCFVYTALGFPPDIIFPLTAIARVQGYMARWREFMMSSPPIWRPQQIYTGVAAKHSSKL